MRILLSRDNFSLRKIKRKSSREVSLTRHSNSASPFRRVFSLVFHHHRSAKFRVPFESLSDPKLYTFQVRGAPRRRLCPLSSARIFRSFLEFFFLFILPVCRMIEVNTSLHFRPYKRSICGRVIHINRSALERWYGIFNESIFNKMNTLLYADFSIYLCDWVSFIIFSDIVNIWIFRVIK